MGATGRDPRIARWLEAEAHDEDGQAEAALRDLFSALPRPGLPSAFADRVLARVAAEPAPWPLERAAACLLLLCGVALAGTRLWLPAVWTHFEPGSWIGAGADLLVGLAQALAALAPLWKGAVKVAEWVALAGASPQVLALLAACALLAATAGRMLLAVLEERSPGHAQA
jgi:hypothetical protein